MSEFTKGEWEIFGDWGIRAKKSERQLCENNCHATFEYDRGGSDEGFANAHLIAAAPSMYAMLEELLTHFQHGNSDHFQLNDEKIKPIEALIKKARGE